MLRNSPQPLGKSVQVWLKSALYIAPSTTQSQALGPEMWACGFADDSTTYGPLGSNIKTLHVFCPETCECTAVDKRLGCPSSCPATRAPQSSAPVLDHCNSEGPCKAVARCYSEACEDGVMRTDSVFAGCAEVKGECGQCYPESACSAAAATPPESEIAALPEP